MSNRSNGLSKNDVHHGKKRYIVQMSLFFVVLAHPLNPSMIDIIEKHAIDGNEVPKDELNTIHLKKLIWHEIRNSEDNNKEANKLTLWKVEDLREGNNKWKILETLREPYNKDDIEQQLRGVMLLSTNVLFTDVWQNGLPKKSIHIIVKLPPSTTALGKRKIMDLDEDRDQKKGKPTVPELTNAQDIKKKIMELPDNSDVYSNPKNILLLPFPFIGLKKPVERFSFNDDGFFTFMGRRKFKNVLDKISDLRVNYGFMEMFVYGTMGYGKSYILSAITCYLIRVNKHVVFLPDCRALSLEPVEYIKSALFLTYVDDPEKIHRISVCKKLGEIEDFFNSVNETLYIIIDQLNALDGNNNGVTQESKIEIKRSINKMCFKHFYIKSASANNEWALVYKMKQTNELKIALYGGFEKDEMSEWWARHGHILDNNEREHQMKEIEDITGCVPLFLNYYVEPDNGNSNNETFNLRKNRLIKNVENKIKPNLDQFSISKFKSASEYDKNRYVEVMTSFITNTKPPAHIEEDYDHRYFYVEENASYNKYEVGHYICGLARNHMAEFLYEKFKMNIFTDVKWINSMKMFKDNPSVLGFFMEKACIASISRDGLMVDKSSFKPNRTEFFSSENDIIVREKKCTLFIPYSWNYDAIDGLILLHEKVKKNNDDSVHVIPIQITITKPSRHSDSEKKFFDGAWKKLKEKLTNYKNVKVSFVWITCRGEASSRIEQNLKEIRGKIIEVNPSYNREVISFRIVNKDIDDEFLFSDRDI